MEVRYSLSVVDVARFSLYRFPRSTAGRLVLGFSLAGFTHSVLRAVGPISKLTPAEVVAALTIVAILTLGLYFFVGLFALLTAIVGGNRTMRAERVLSLSDDGACEVSPFETRRTAWAGILAVRRTRRYIMLFVADCAAHVIPRRCFSSDNEASAFFEYASTRAGKAAHAAAPDGGRVAQ